MKKADIDRNVVKVLVVVKWSSTRLMTFQKTPLAFVCFVLVLIWFGFFCLLVRLFCFVVVGFSFVCYLFSFSFVCLLVSVRQIQVLFCCIYHRYSMWFWNHADLDASEKTSSILGSRTAAHQLSGLGYLYLLCHHFGLMLESDHVSVFEGVHWCDLHKTGLTLSKSIDTHQWRVRGHSLQLKNTLGRQVLQAR